MYLLLKLNIITFFYNIKITFELNILIKTVFDAVKDYSIVQLLSIVNFL